MNSLQMILMRVSQGIQIVSVLMNFFSIDALDFYFRPNWEEEYLWKKMNEEQQGVIKSDHGKKHVKKSERERDLEWRKARAAARLPRIHVHLKDLAMEEGHNVRLMTNISGPELSIRWLKDGVAVERGPKYRILINEGIIGLEIIKATPKDSGEYTCAVSNSNGNAATTAIVTIYEVIKDDPTPPTFTSARGMCKD